MSELVNFMKEVYEKAEKNDFEWKPLYPNNMPCNGQEGVYTYMFFKDNDKYTYVKYTIEYFHKVDEEGITRPEDKPRYYVLHGLIENAFAEKFEIPEPNNKCELDGLGLAVNDYGNFYCVFDDEDTAKKVVSAKLKGMIFPYQYILAEEEIDEWIEFLKSKGEISK